jgi:uncharacterized protein (DUF1501 family)
VFAGFSLGADPASGDFKVRDLSLSAGVDEPRFNTRRKMLDVVNDYFREKEKSDALDAVDTFYQRAYDLISSEKAREAFDITKETDQMRDTYGKNTAGMRLLLCRRLVEAGVRFVTTTYGGWDMHDNIHASMNGQVPAFDQAYAALIRDLEQRGLLDSTMVVIASEFGRTPKINGTAGRDHWPKVFSVVMSGGGIRKGIVYGSSDATASEPNENPLSVADWATTIYDRMGINADKELMAPGDRPIEIVDSGNVIKDLLA